MIPLWVVSGLAAATIAGATGFWTAWELQAGAHAKYLVTQANNARAAERIRRQNTDTAAVGFEKARVEIRTKYVPITEEVERVVTKVEYRDRMCLDADGVRAANHALRGLANDPGKLGPTLPASAPTP